MSADTVRGGPTLEIMQRALAGEEGWTNISYRYIGLCGKPPESYSKNHHVKWLSGDDEHLGRMGYAWLPNYLNDLNAMHEIEKTLDKALHYDYVNHLVDLTQAEWTDDYAEVMVVAHATAAQRAEAFLHVKRPDLFK